MNYKNENITARAQESTLWKDVETQSGDALPYLLERYLLLENWRNLVREDGEEPAVSIFDVHYLHYLLAEATTVLLGQEERIRRLEKALGDSNNP